MPNSKLTTAERQRFARAREHGRRYAMRATAVLDARYDATRDRLELTLRTSPFRPRAMRFHGAMWKLTWAHEDFSIAKDDRAE